MAKKVTVTWTDPSPTTNVDHLEIWRKTGVGGTYAQIGTDISLAAANSYEDTNGGSGLADGTTYYYQVRAYNSTGDYSNIEASITISAVAAPNAPTNLLPGTPTSSTLPLTWTKSTSGVMTAYRVYDDGVLLQTFTGDVASGTLTGLTASTTYTNLTVRAWNGTTESSNSNAVNGTTASVATIDIFPQDNAASLSNTDSIGTWVKTDSRGDITVQTTLNEVGVSERLINCTSIATNTLSRMSIVTGTIKKGYAYRLNAWLKALGTIQTGCQDFQYNSGFATLQAWIPANNNWNEYSHDTIGVVNGTGNVSGYMKNAATADDKTLLINKFSIMELGPVIEDVEEYYTANAAGKVNEANALTGLGTGYGATNESISTDVANGSYAIKSTRDLASASTMLSLPFNAVIGQFYKITIWAKKATAGANCRFYNWLGAAVVTTDITTTWTEYTFYVKATGTTISINMHHDSTDGTINGQIIYADGLSVKKVTMPS